MEGWHFSSRQLLVLLAPNTIERTLRKEHTIIAQCLKSGHLGWNIVQGVQKFVYFDTLLFWSRFMDLDILQQCTMERVYPNWNRDLKNWRNWTVTKNLAINEYALNSAETENLAELCPKRNWNCQNSQNRSCFSQNQIFLAEIWRTRIEIAENCRNDRNRI